MKYIKLFESLDIEEIENYLIDLRDELDGARGIFKNDSKINVSELSGSFEISYPNGSNNGGFALIQKDPFEITNMIEEFKNRVEHLGYKSKVDVKFANVGPASRFEDDISFSFKIRFDRI